jgi:glucosamine kinase
LDKGIFLVLFAVEVAMAAYFLGIDGGGTSCRAALSNVHGELIGRGKSGAANILTDPDTALKHIIAATEAAFKDADIEPALSQTYAVLGHAGTNVGSAVDYIKSRLPFANAELVSDGLIALQGALGDEDGAIAILGTGSVFMLRKGDVVQSIGGWGFKAGDFGSGAKLGQALLQQALLAGDGIRPVTPGLSAVLERFSDRLEDLANFAAEAKPGDFGSLAPLVFEFAQKGDVCAFELISDAARTVDAALSEVQRRLGGAGKISLLGGIAPLLRPHLDPSHQTHLIDAKDDAVIGALALAQRMVISAKGVNA